jgi:flavin-dependent dehydrogenase
MTKHYDVAILGGGMAGLTLARHLLLETDKTILLLERRSEIPPPRQKVGESTVQVGGYYISKVLDLEEHLLSEHFLKYNLRFCWKSAGRSNTGFEDYALSFIRPLSNVASYQLNRNALERELLSLNLTAERFTLQLAAASLDVDLAPSATEGPHKVTFRHHDATREVSATWVVDTTGRARTLARKLEMKRPNPIRNASFYWWVEGLVDVGKLTELSSREMRKRPERAALGHLPLWLSTNHFCDEGVWCWVIPLQGKTSLGIVYDPEVVAHDDVFSVEKATRWLCERFPLFARDLPQRKVLDQGGFKSYSYDCVQTINPARWAMSGDAGRFSDPLYSPGSDLIAIYNTLIVDAIRTDDAQELSKKCTVHEQLMRAMYSAYLPSYTMTYNTLGDQEVFSLKYVWELSIYFGFYVFPFINDFFTDRRFVAGFLRAFSRLGAINPGMHKLLSGYYQWKKVHAKPPLEPIYFDFTDISTLCAAEQTFYKVGIDTAAAKKVLAEQLQHLEELARFVAIHIAGVVTGDETLVTNRAAIEEIDVTQLDFDVAAIHALQARHAEKTETYTWPFNPFVMERFHQETRMSEAMEKNEMPEMQEMQEMQEMAQ